MDAIQVSEASMVSMFRRAADAIVNESSLKDEVDQLRMTTEIQGRNLERLGNDKTSLNDYVAELQRQLSEAKARITELNTEAYNADQQINRLKDDNATLETLLNETEQARDSHKTRADENYTHFTKQQDMYIEAKAKLDGILKTLGAILPQGQSESHPTSSTTSQLSTESGETHPETSDTNHGQSEAAPEVAAEPTFPQVAQQPDEHIIAGSSGLSEPWGSSDTSTPPDYPAPPEACQPVESSHTVAPSAGEPHPNKPSDWMSF